MNRRQLVAAGVILFGLPASTARAIESTPAATPTALQEPLDFAEARYYHSDPNARYRNVALRVAQWESPDAGQASLDAFLTWPPAEPDHDEYALSPIETVALPPLDGPDFASLVTLSITEGAAAHHTGYARLGIRRSRITWTASVAAENAGAAIDLAITFAETIVAWRPTTCGNFVDWLPGPETIPDGMWLDSVSTPEGVTRDDPRDDDPVASPATPAATAAHPMSMCFEEE